MATNTQRKNKILEKIKYISVNPASKNNVFTIAVPTHKGNAPRALKATGLKKAIALRNRVGEKIWGDYWGAVLSGYIDTVQSESASVSVHRFFDKRRGQFEWRVMSVALIGNKYKSKTFSENKYGKKQAETLARAYASLETESRLEQLKNWKPRWIRTPRDSPASIYRNRGTLAVK